MPIKMLNKYPGSHNDLKFPIVIAANQGVIERGQVLARLTSGGQYVKVDTGASDGSQTPVGIAPQEYPDSATAQPGVLQYDGRFVKSDLVGLTTQVITNFGSRASDVLGQDLFILR